MLFVDSRIYGLAVNPNEDQLYISDKWNRKIVVTDLVGNGRKTIIEFPGYPEALTVDLKRR